VDQVYYDCLDLDSQYDLSGQEVTVRVTFQDEDGHVDSITAIGAAN
jgi:hypothetical protein